MMNNQIFTNINPFLIEDQIVDSTLQPCPKAIVDKIKNLQQNDFAAIIAKFGGANAPYDLNINSVLTNSISGNLAETYIALGTNALGINIDISIEHMTTSTKLSIACTILHEFVHAYFLSLLRDQIIGGNITITQHNLGYLWEFYVARTYGTNANLAQHQQIAETYIASIASALKEFQTGICVSAGVQPQQLYKDLAWGGLKGTVPFNALSTTEENRINAVIFAEENNTTSTVNGVVALPTSQPCN